MKLSNLSPTTLALVLAELEESYDSMPSGHKDEVQLCADLQEARDALATYTGTVYHSAQGFGESLHCAIAFHARMVREEEKANAIHD